MNVNEFNILSTVSPVDDEKKMLKRTNSFVGTAQFVAPEILKRGTIHMGSDECQ